jgi:outer membrane protein TolC
MIISRSLLSAGVVAGMCASVSVARAEDDTLTLAKAYQLAVRYNDALQQAATELDAENIRLADTWSQVRPTVDATLQAGLSRKEFNNPDKVHGEAASVIARPPLFRMGLFAEREAGKLSVKSAELEVAVQRETLARDVADAYVDVVRTRSIVELSGGAVERAQDQYDHAVARVKAGSALKTAELLAQIDVKRAERQLVAAKGEAGVAEAALRRLIGIAPPKTLEPPVPPANPPAPAEGYKTAVKRPAIRAFAIDIDAAEQRAVSAEGKRFWPTIDLQASASFFNPAPIIGQDSAMNDITASYDWEILGVITIPLLQSGAESTQVKLRRNEARLAELELERQKKLLAQDVEAAAVLLTAATENADLAHKQYDTARAHYDLVDKQFKLGAITFLEVTNATSALAEAEIAQEVARMDKIRAAYDYLYLIGALDLRK